MRVPYRMSVMQKAHIVPASLFIILKSFGFVDGGQFVWFYLDQVGKEWNDSLIFGESCVIEFVW